jgi:hypothetical protein
VRRALLVALVACGAARTARPITLVREALPVTGLVVELADTTFVFDHRTVTVLRGGAVAARAEAPFPWRAATTIAAPDGNGRWVVGTTSDGELWHVTPSAEIEAERDRLGLADTPVTLVDAAGSTIAALLANGIAVSTDGVHMARVDLDHPHALVAARGRLAIATLASVEVWDLVHSSRVTYPIGSAILAFTDADRETSRLAVASGRRLYLEVAGSLHRIDCPATIRALAPAGSRLWVLADRLYLIQDDRLVATDADTSGAVVELHGSRTGDVWVGHAGQLARYSLGHPDDDPTWRTQVAPVFQRVCSHCHLPGGSADIDLSTPATWRTEHDEIVRRVIVTRTMPPAGTDLGDADRHALETWLSTKP